MSFEFSKNIIYYNSSYDCHLGDLFQSDNKIFKNDNLSAFENSVVAQLISNELPIIGGFGFVPLMFHSDIEKGYAFPIHDTSSEFVLSANDKIPKPHWDGEGLDEHRYEYNNQFTEGSEKVSYRWSSQLNESINIDGGYAYNEFKGVNNGLYVGRDVDGDLNFQSLTNVATKNIELHNHTNFYGVDLNTNNDTNRTSETEYNDVISYITPYSDISYTCGIGVQCNFTKCYPLLFEGVNVDKFFKITESDSFTLNGDVTYEPRQVCETSNSNKIGGVFILYLPINQLNRCCIEVLYNNIAKSYIDDNDYYTQGISIPAYAKSVVDDYCNGATTCPKMFYQEVGSQKYLYFEKIHYIDDSGVKFVKNKKIQIQDTNSDYFCFIHNNMCIIKNSTFSKFVFDDVNKFNLLDELFS